MEIGRITSTSNSQVKKLIGLKNKAQDRRKEGVFLVEGMKMYRETPKDRIVSIYIEEKFSELYGSEIVEDYTVVSDSVFKQISDTVTPQGILLVVRQKRVEIEKILTKDKKQLINIFFYFTFGNDFQSPVISHVNIAYSDIFFRQSVRYNQNLLTVF